MLLIAAGAQSQTAVMPDALQLVESCARKYQEIGSYEGSATGRASLTADITAEVRLKFAYASAKMTPPDLPVPMLPQVMQLGWIEFLTGTGTP